MRVRLTNVTLTADFGEKVDLIALYKFLDGRYNVVYDPVLDNRRIVVPIDNATAIVYATGKVQVVGAKSLEDAINTLSRILWELYILATKQRENRQNH